MVCAILHNIAIQSRIPLPETEVDDPPPYDADEGGNDRPENAVGGMQVRNAIVQSWF